MVIRLGGHEMVQALKWLFAGILFACNFNAYAKISEQEKQIKIEKKIFDQLKNMTEVYSAETGLHSKFKRTQILSLLGETEESKGELFYSQKKLRMDFKGSNKSMVLITPQEIWNVTYDGDKPESIIKSKPTPMPLLDLLFGDKSIWDKFDILNIHTNTESRIDVTLKPKRDSGITYVSRVRFNLDTKKNTVKKLIYWDDVDNETQMSFTYNKFKDKFKESLFKFNPPKDATVTVM